MNGCIEESKQLSLVTPNRLTQSECSLLEFTQYYYWQIDSPVTMVSIHDKNHHCFKSAIESRLMQLNRTAF